MTKNNLKWFPIKSVLCVYIEKTVYYKFFFNNFKVFLAEIIELEKMCFALSFITVHSISNYDRVIMNRNLLVSSNYFCIFHCPYDTHNFHVSAYAFADNNNQIQNKRKNYPNKWRVLSYTNIHVWRFWFGFCSVILVFSRNVFLNALLHYSVITLCRLEFTSISILKINLQFPCVVMRPTTAERTRDSVAQITDL